MATAPARRRLEPRRQHPLRASIPHDRIEGGPGLEAPLADSDAHFGVLEALRSPVFQALRSPLLAAVLVAGFARPGEALHGSVLAFAMFASGIFVTRREIPWVALCRISRGLRSVAGPLLATFALAGLSWVVPLPALSLAGWLAVGAAVTFAAVLPALVVPRFVTRPPLSIAVIGSRRTAQGLARELTAAGVTNVRVVGYIAANAVVSGTSERSCEDGLLALDDMPGADAPKVPSLGSISDLDDVLKRHRLGLLVLGSEVPRLPVFDVLARSCLHTPVSLCQLSAFYEETFGHVPVAEINASWFQCMMHPRYHRQKPICKRPLDVLMSAIFGLVFLPAFLIVALLIRRDGGPAMFKQVRIGEGGRPFVIYKLRTMRADTNAAAQWASDDDCRITRIGRFLRRTHLDELPQIINVLRGEMSMVGPRPEQPVFVDRLEQLLPFYQRRHLVKPGLTGWAQVRCGYAGSEIGSAWKLSYELFYMKHRSTAFDLVILAETVLHVLAKHKATHDLELGIFVTLRGPGSVAMREEPPIAVSRPARDALPSTSDLQAHGFRDASVSSAAVDY